MELENEITIKSEDIWACRACLTTDIKLFDLRTTQFSSNLLVFTGIQLSSQDGIPHYICTYCHYQMQKFAAFRTRCQGAKLALEQLQKESVISTESIQRLNRKSLTLNLSKTSIHTLKIPTENGDTKPFEVFTIKPLNFQIELSENAMISNNNFIDNSSIDNERKSNCNKRIINPHGSFDDSDYSMNIKYNNTSQNHNTVDAKEKKGINKDKKHCKKRNRQTHSHKLSTKHRLTNNRDITLQYQSDNIEKDKLMNSKHDQIIILGNDDIENISDFDYDASSNNDEFIDNSIFIKENEHIHDLDDKLVYNNTKKSVNKKGVKKLRNSRKKTEEINIKEENLNIENSVIETGTEEDNSESNIGYINKKNTKELKSLKSVDSKSILPEFMSLFAKPKNDNFFSKDNMDNFSKEYQVDIILLSKEDQIKELESRKNATSYIRADFKCEICYKGFVIESSYKSHIVFHDESRGDFSCEICAVRYGTKRQVLTHHRQTHAVNFVCNICGHATKNIKRAKFHYNHHQGVKITCKHCGKQFSQRAQHMNHVRSAHGSARCDICGMLFISATGVSRHKFWQHKEVVGVNCDTCSAEFHSIEALNKHRTSGCTTNFKPCPTCGTNFSNQESLQTHIEEVHWKTDNAFKCSKCSKTYSSEKLLKIHLREHRRSQRTGEGVTPSFMCEVCGRSFMDRKYLRDHQRLHTGDKPYQCDVCSKTFRLPSTHRAHMDRHANLRRYQCSICPKTFTQAGHRAAHVRRHTNEKPFACSTCGRRFSCSGNARHHLRAVHMGIRRSRKPPADRCEPSI